MSIQPDDAKTYETDLMRRRVEREAEDRRLLVLKAQLREQMAAQQSMVLTVTDSQDDSA
jgi:hypothetical protein